MMATMQTGYPRVARTTRGRARITRAHKGYARSVSDLRIDLREAAEGAVEHVEEAASREYDAYRAGHERPLGGYAVLLSIYSATTIALAWLVRRRGVRVAFTPRDVVELGVATHKLSRLVTKDTVTAVARAPFTKFVEPSGEGEVHEEVRGSGMRHAVGELLSCPFCIAVWVATGLAFGLVLAPRITRIITTMLCAVAGSDYLQLAYARLQQAAKDD